MKETIEVTDIFKGAYFLCSGAELVSTRLIDDQREIVSFVFEGEGIDKLEEAYNRDGALVNPRKLRIMLNLLRDVMFRIMREEKEAIAC